jgi:hypothetical protein
MAVCEKRSLLPSLAGVKGLFRCAVQQSSKSSIAILQCIGRPVILELEANFFINARATVLERVESLSSDNDNALNFSSENGDSSEVVGL